MDKKMSIYANWKYSTFDRVLARRNNLDLWEPGFYSRTVTMPDGYVGYLLVGCGEVFKEIVPYTDLTAELVGTIALAPTFSPADVDGWVCDREPWFTVGTPVLCSNYLPGDEGWNGGRFGIAQYFSNCDAAYQFNVVCELGRSNDPNGAGVIIDFSSAAFQYVKKLCAADLTSEQREIYEAWQAAAYDRLFGAPRG